MIFFGIGTLEKVSIVFWASVWPIITTTRETARSLDNNLIKAVRAMGANRWELFSKVIFPFTLPNLFTGLKLAISTAFFMIVAAELVGSKDGLGWYYMSQQHTYKLDLVYGSVLFITALAILFRWLFGRLEKKFIVWKEAAFR
jgi:NitT/TauT family transport system permease protein